jgi:PAS domain S-box
MKKKIILDEITNLDIEGDKGYANLAKAFPVSHGIIHSFDELPEGYEYMSVDGTDRCISALENIDSLSNVFLEMNTCLDSCVNGPCSLSVKGGSLKATSDVKNYVRKERQRLPLEKKEETLNDIDFTFMYPRIRNNSKVATESEIVEILHKTGKYKPEDELNCGACGYSTCREKAWAVLNGFAGIEICLPFMRQRAESMSYEVIHNSPEGIIVVDEDLNIMDVNAKGIELLGIMDSTFKGRPVVDFFPPIDFLTALSEKHNLECKKVFIASTKKYIDLSINLLKDQKVLFGIMKDVTTAVNYNDQLTRVKLETLAITDEVIKKQMRVAQEIASLLGETTAETKVALLNLKKTLQQDKKGDE